MSANQSSVMNSGLKLAAPRSLYFAIFAISGFSGLIYESIWSHYLKLFLGHAAYAQSLVLMIFMGGMALGSWLASRFTVNKRSPLLLYAGVELVVGLAALLFHGVFTSIIDGFYSSVLPSVESPFIGASLKWLAASTLIMPQSILLGMTFPLMSAGIIRRFPDTPGGSIAMLYFTNSIGAAIGVLASGFWLISVVGLPGTIFTAGLLNIALALTVWMLVRMDPNPVAAPIKTAPISESSSTLKTLFLVAAFITGAASFIYEISWIRMLSLVLGATTHSFELMLSAFITGLAFGGLWIKRRIDRIESPVRFSGYVQLIMGVLALLTIPVYVMSFGSMEWLLRALQPTDAGFAGYSFVSHAIALSVMLPTTFMAGMTLPLFTYVLIRKGFGEASIGQVYAANTVGAIVGVLFAVHIGLPFLGLKWLIVFGAALDIILGLVLLFRFARDRTRSYELPLAALVSLGAVALTVSMASLDKELLVSGIYRMGKSVIGEGDKVVYYKDGKTATVALIAKPSGHVTLSTNGKPDAAIGMHAEEAFGGDEITMTLLGALPIAYMPEARTVANIGMGSGMTTHTLLGYEGIRRVDTIEIEPAMVEAATGFGEFVDRAFSDPRSRIHIEDAKTYFSLNNSLYDVIVAEPSNPWVSGVSSLFSSEFYATAKRHIREGGLFVQWIQLYEFNDELAESILKALSQNFDDYVIYTTNGGDLVLVARNGGPVGKPDWSAMFSPDVAPQLARYGVKTHADMEYRMIVSREYLLPLLRMSSTPVNSDYFPYVDLHAGQARFKRTMSDMFDKWMVSSVPMIEMFDDADVNFGDLSEDPSLTRAQRHQNAVWQYERIVNKASLKDVESVSDNFRPEVMYLADLVRNAVQHCEPVADTEKFRFAIHDVMTRTLPYLPAEQAVEIVNTIEATNCSGMDLEHREAWFDLYRGVAARNSISMLNNARTLLAAEGELPAVLDEYLISAALLGAITLDRGDEAVQLWTEWGEAIYASKEMPADVRLLVSIALDSGTQVANSN